MKRWDEMQKKFVVNEAVDAFLADIEEVSKKHNMSISHQDTEGSFVVAKRNKRLVSWLNDASIKNIGHSRL